MLILAMGRHGHFGSTSHEECDVVLSLTRSLTYLAKPVSMQHGGRARTKDGGRGFGRPLSPLEVQKHRAPKVVSQKHRAPKVVRFYNNPLNENLKIRPPLGEILATRLMAQSTQRSTGRPSQTILSISTSH